MCRLAKIKKIKIKKIYKTKKTKRTNGQKSLGKILKQSNEFQVAKIVYCRCTGPRHTLIFGIRKAWPPPIGTCEIDELPKASIVELLVTKQDPNSCDRVG